MTDCIEWNGKKDSDGYGRVQYRGPGSEQFKSKQWFAHRVAWTLTNGPIPKGLCVLHKCDNPPCVNPDHLWLGTKGANMQDKIQKGRGANQWGPW